MEKINREELMKMMNLTEEELEKVAGGALGTGKCEIWGTNAACKANCDYVQQVDEQECIRISDWYDYEKCCNEVKASWSFCRETCDKMCPR